MPTATELLAQLGSLTSAARADNFEPPPAAPPSSGLGAPQAPLTPSGLPSPTAELGMPEAAPQAKAGLSATELLKMLDAGQPTPQDGGQQHISPITGQPYTPQEMQQLEGVGTVDNVLRTVNKSIATALGAPFGVVNEISRQAGAIMQRAVGMDPNDPKNQQFMPASAQKVAQWMRKKFEDMGISTQPDPTAVSTHAAEMGMEALMNVAAMAAVLPSGAAPGAAAVAPKTSQILGQIGDYVRAHPWITGAQEIGAAVGAQEMQKEYPDNPMLAGTIGGLAGGAVGGGAASMVDTGARALGRTAVSLGQRFANRAAGEGFKPNTEATPYVPYGSPGQPLTPVEYGVARASSPIINALPAKAQYPVMDTLMKGTLGAENLVGRTVHSLQQPQALRGVESRGNPFRDPNSDVQYARTYAKSQLNQDLMAAEQAVRDAIDTVPASTTSVRRLNADIYAALEVNARPLVKEMENKFWSRVDLERPIPRPGLKERLEEYKGSMSQEALDNVPSKYIKELDGLLKVKQGRNELGQLTATTNPLTMRRLRNFDSALSAEIASEQNAAAGGRAARSGYIRNLSRLGEVVRGHMNEVYPNDIRLSQAKDFSEKYHDIFSRSNLYSLLGQKSVGPEKVAPEQTIDWLSNRYKGLEDIFTMTGAFSKAQRVPGATGKDNPTIVTRAERATFKGIEDQIKTTIQAQLRDHATRANYSPEQVQKYIRAQTPSMENVKGLAQVHKSFVDLDRQLSEIGVLKDMTQKSRLAQFVQADNPHLAIKAAMSSQQPVSALRAITNGVKGDKQALEAVQNTVADFFFVQSKMDPGVMRRTLNAPKNLADPEGKMRALLETVYAPTPDKLERLTKMVTVAGRLQSGEDKGIIQRYGKNAVTAARVIGAKGYTMLSHLFGMSGGLQAASFGSQYGRDLATGFIARRSPQALLKNAINTPAWEQFLYSRSPETVRDMNGIALSARRLISLETGLMKGYLVPQNPIEPLAEPGQ